MAQWKNVAGAWQRSVGGKIAPVHVSDRVKGLVAGYSQEAIHEGLPATAQIMGEKLARGEALSRSSRAQAFQGALRKGSLVVGGIAAWNVGSNLLGDDPSIGSAAVVGGLGFAGMRSMKSGLLRSGMKFGMRRGPTPSRGDFARVAKGIKS